MPNGVNDSGRYDGAYGDPDEDCPVVDEGAAMDRAYEEAVSSRLAMDGLSEFSEGDEL